MGKAILIFEFDERDPSGWILCGKVWKVPEPVEGSGHEFKYRLFFGYPGRSIVRYDNERGKGDHKHVLDTESAYAFTGHEQLLADFQADIRAWLAGELK